MRVRSTSRRTPIGGEEFVCQGGGGTRKVIVVGKNDIAAIIDPDAGGGSISAERLLIGAKS